MKHSIPMQRSASPRYEIKLRCRPHYLAQVHAWVRLHPAHWRVLHPPRQVNNVYFDTFDHKGLNDNLSGTGIRSKLRLRWYGTVLKTISEAQLELKYKEGMVGWKDICPLVKDHRLTLDLAHECWPDLRQAILNATDDRANLWLAQYAYPVLINHYQRAYYATPDQSVRLTIDSNLTVYDQRYSAQPNLHRPSPITDCVIIELKAERQHYSQLVSLLDGFPIRTDRYSKYVQGMLAAPDFAEVGPL